MQMMNNCISDIFSIMYLFIWQLIYQLPCILVYTVSDLNFFSANFTLIGIKKNIGTFNFVFTTSPNLLIMEEYVVTISPPPTHGSDEIITSSTTIFSLENETQYNITIYFRACPERFNATLIFGKISKPVIY